MTTNIYNFLRLLDMWELLIVPTLLAIVVMFVYGFWDKITGMEYYVDDDILGYDEEMLKEG